MLRYFCKAFPKNNKSVDIKSVFAYNLFLKRFVSFAY